MFLIAVTIPTLMDVDADGIAIVISINKDKSTNQTLRVFDILEPRDLLRCTEVGSTCKATVVELVAPRLVRIWTG